MSAPTTKDRSQPERSQHRSETSISLRVSRPLLDLITTAAAVAGKSRTEFMLESARQDAIDALLDQRLFQLDDEQYEAFLRVLDDPPPPNEALKRLMTKKASWDS